MMRHYLTGAIRNLWQQKLGSLIYLLSMATGLAVFAFAFLHVKHEYGYDRQWPDAERIHRLLLTQQGVPDVFDGETDRTEPVTVGQLQQYFPDELAGITKMDVLPVLFGDEQATYNLHLVDTGFPSVFELEAVTGNLAEALATPGVLALSEQVAATLPAGEIIGRRLMVRTEFGSPVEFEVGAVYRLPDHVSAQVYFQSLTGMYDYALPLLRPNSSSWNDAVRVWAKLKPGITTAAFNAAQPAFIDQSVTRYNEQLKAGERISDHLSYRFQPVTAMYFEPFLVEGGGDKARTLTIAAIGLLVLLVACSNTLSLGLATVLERRREIGIRKVNGAAQGDVAGQYLVEAVVLVIVALLPAFALMEVLRPLVSGLMNLRQMPPPTLGDYATLASIAVTVGLLNSLYPAAVLAGVRPQRVLRPQAGSHRSALLNVRTLLVGFQFCFSLILLISTLTLYKQLQLTREQPMGFSGDNLLVMLFGNAPPEAVNGFAESLRKLAGVNAVLPTFVVPNENMPQGINTVSLVSKEETIIEAAVSGSAVGPGNFALWRIPLLAGRDFDAVLDRQDPETGKLAGLSAEDEVRSRVILNRSAMEVLGFADAQSAIGKRVYTKGRADPTSNTIVDVPHASFCWSG